MNKLVLLGAGHTHLAALRWLSRRGHLGPQASPGASLAEITLINDGSSTFYSGMVPGYIQGRYEISDFEVPLRSFCEKLGIQFRCERAAAIETDRVVLTSGETVVYDILSVNFGSTTRAIASDSESCVLQIRPFQKFIQQWEGVKGKVAEDPFFRTAVIGGGPAAIEVTAAIQSIRPASGISVQMFFPEKFLLSSWPGVGVRVTADLEASKIQLHPQFKLEGIEKQWLHWVNPATAPSECFDLIILCTGSESVTKNIAVESSWLDQGGYFKINESLQVIAAPNVFASGDCAAFPIPLQKSGVHAIRQGPVLAHNLIACLQGFKLRKALKKYRPPQKQLYILTNGAKSARSLWGNRSFAGRSMLVLKDWIDRRYVAGLKA